MLTDIRHLQGVKLYYPYLRPDIGPRMALRKHLDSILGLVLFSDYIVLPPSDVFDSDHFRANLAIVDSDARLSALLEQHILVFTTVSDTARDLSDIIEYYSGEIPPPGHLTRFPVFYRDQSLQTRDYSSHLISAISHRKDLSTSHRDELLHTLNNTPTHKDILAFQERSDAPAGEKRIVHFLAMDAYRRGGQTGNDAIVPPHSKWDNSYIYNHFYSPSILCQIRFLAERSLKKPISELKPEELVSVARYLRSFHMRYAQLSQIYTDMVQTLHRSIWPNKYHPLLTRSAIHAGAGALGTAVMANTAGPGSSEMAPLLAILLDVILDASGIVEHTLKTLSRSSLVPRDFRFKSEMDATMSLLVHRIREFREQLGECGGFSHGS